MIRFLVNQYRLGLRIGCGRRHAISRAIRIYRAGF